MSGSRLGILAPRILRDHPFKQKLLEELDTLGGMSVSNLMGLSGNKPSPLGPKYGEILVEDVDSPRERPAAEARGARGAEAGDQVEAEEADAKDAEEEEEDPAAGRGRRRRTTTGGEPAPKPTARKPRTSRAKRPEDRNKPGPKGKGVDKPKGDPPKDPPKDEPDPKRLKKLEAGVSSLHAYIYAHVYIHIHIHILRAPRNTHTTYIHR